MRLLLCWAMMMILNSCELHRQEAYSNVQEVNKVFANDTIDLVFDAASKDDIFKLQEYVAEDPGFINIINDQGQSLLGEAIKAKSLLSVEFLLSVDADTDYQDTKGRSIDDIISDFDMEEQLKVYWRELVATGVIAQELLDREVVQLINTTAQDTQEENWRTLRLYFDKGADVNATDARNRSLLVLAATNNLPVMTERLCGFEGVDMSFVDRRVMRFLQGQLRRNPQFQVIINILVRHGA